MNAEEKRTLSVLGALVLAGASFNYYKYHGVKNEVDRDPLGSLLSYSQLPYGLDKKAAEKVDDQKVKSFLQIGFEQSGSNSVIWNDEARLLKNKRIGIPDVLQAFEARFPNRKSLQVDTIEFYTHRVSEVVGPAPSGWTVNDGIPSKLLIRYEETPNL